MLHKPDLLFLDEPTSAVDPQSRREFWDSLFELADQGTTLLVSTHYMDEAERCTRLAILDRGRIVADGTPHELMAGLPGRTLLVEHAASRAARSTRCAISPGVIALAQIGTSLRVLAAHDAELERRVDGAAARAPAWPAQVAPDGAEPRGRVRRGHPQADGDSAVSSARLGSIVVKELRQLRRDRLTFAMIIGIPIDAAVLFGYAINLDVRNLETAVLDQANTARSRELIAGMAATGVVQHRPRASRARRRSTRCCARATISAALVMPPDFETRMERRDRPPVQIIVDGSEQVIQSRRAAARGLSCSTTTAAGRRTAAASRS